MCAAAVWSLRCLVAMCGGWGWGWGWGRDGVCGRDWVCRGGGVGGWIWHLAEQGRRATLAAALARACQASPLPHQAMVLGADCLLRWRWPVRPAGTTGEGRGPAQRDRTMWAPIVSSQEGAPASTVGCCFVSKHASFHHTHSPVDTGLRQRQPAVSRAASRGWKPEHPLSGSSSPWTNPLPDAPAASALHSLSPESHCNVRHLHSTT